ncbi:MAG: hypothetical protein KC657_00115 [Myxococcales bacterium]|nr:hypothetical protein [Myxococcales bacterium]
MKASTKIRGLAFAGAAFLAPSAASAAAPPPCMPAVVAPATSAIPVNLPGFAYTALKATTQDIHLYDAATRQELPVRLEPSAGVMKMTPQDPLVVGTRYRIESKPFCSYSAVPAQEPFEFVAAAAAPIPTTVGTLRGAPTVKVEDRGTAKLIVNASYELTDEMKPWATVYQLLVVVDGRPIATKTTFSSPLASADLSATGWCDETNAGTATHTIQLRARLPFSPDIDSATTTATFDCPAPKIAKPPAPTIAPGATPPPGAPAQPASSSGGGCSAAHTPTHAAFVPALALALAAGAFARRTARRSKGGS